MPYVHAWAGWRDVMTHPAAARQQTAIGRTLVELQRVGSRIHIGYGDYSANTGPIDVYAWFAPVRRLKYQGLRVNTEAVLNYRRIGARVYVISADPKDMRGHNFASAHVRRAGSWSRKRVGAVVESPLAAVHIYDVVWFDGALWAAGGMANNRAALWRSTDNGNSWSVVLNVAPRSGFSNDTARFFFIGLHRNKLYVQGYDHCGGAGCSHNKSRVFDGDRWRTGPDLLRGAGMGYRPVKFRGEMILRSYENAYYPSNLLAFDGFGVRDPLPWRQSIHDYAVGQDGYLYVLTADINPNDGVNDQHVLRTNDLASWECLFDAPRRNTARTIEVVQVPTNKRRLRAKVYLGTTQSSITSRWVQDRANCDGWW